MDCDQLKYATGIIFTREALTQVLDELRAVDFPMRNISVFIKDSEHKKLHEAHMDKQIMTPIAGSKAGAITGGITGGLLALIAGLGALVIPGVGPALAVESVLTTLLASGASGTFGSLVGAFHGWFEPKKQAKFYAPSSQQEFLVMICGTVDQIRQAKSILRYWCVREWRIHETSSSANE